MTSTFLSPGRLFLLLLIPLLIALYVLLQARRKRYAIRFTNLALLSHIAPRGPGWRRHVGAVLFLISIALMIMGWARPAAPVKVPRERATIIVAVDVSLSMKATDVVPNRFDSARAEAKKFIQELPQRFNVGLVSFAGTASAVTAPTFDRTAVINAVDQLQLDKGTAIGEAVFASLSSLRSFDAKAKEEPPPAHVVLLSDGDNQTGRTITEAADAAKAQKVPVSTIAFGTPYGTVEIDGEQVAVQVDKEALQLLAAGTKGKAYEAAAGGQLSEVYRDIGSSLGYRTEHREIASRYVGIALLLALSAGGASLAWFSRLP
jgi:Ca-activated chloride channel family protein